MGRLEGKVAMITGGASGVGRECVLRFVSEGARVVLTDLNEIAGRALAAEIGENALFLHHDVADEADWTEIRENIIRNHIKQSAADSSYYIKASQVLAREEIQKQCPEPIEP